MDLMEITEKERLSREDAAARLHALADALARHNESSSTRRHALQGARGTRNRAQMVSEANTPTFESDASHAARDEPDPPSTAPGSSTPFGRGSARGSHAAEPADHRSGGAG